MFSGDFDNLSDKNEETDQKTNVQLVSDGLLFTLFIERTLVKYKLQLPHYCVFNICELHFT